MVHLPWPLHCGGQESSLERGGRGAGAKFMIKVTSVDVRFLNIAKLPFAYPQHCWSCFSKHSTSSRVCAVSSPFHPINSWHVHFKKSIYSADSIPEPYCDLIVHCLGLYCPSMVLVQIKKPYRDVAKERSHKHYPIKLCHEEKIVMPPLAPPRQTS